MNDYRIMCDVWAIAPDVLTPAERLVLLRLAFHANAEGRSVFPSVASLCRYTGVCRRSVFGALRQLETLGFISTEQAARAQKTTRRSLNLPAIQQAAPEPRGATTAPVGVQPLHPTGATTAPKEAFKKQIEKEITPRCELEAPNSVSLRSNREGEPEDWWHECDRVHNRSCSSSRQHATQMMLAADRARRAREIGRDVAQRIAATH